MCKKKINILFISLGVENASDSKYAASKAQGENKIFENLPSATILKTIYSLFSERLLHHTIYEFIKFLSNISFVLWR